MKRSLMLFYGLSAYVVTMITIAWSACFFGNLLVPRTIDGAALIPLGDALIVNLSLTAVFALQHSGMARKPFKAWLHRRIPPCLERSTYVLLSCATLLLLFVFWQPMGGVVWESRNAIVNALIYGLYFLGWALMIVATFLIDHLELFGLKQVWATSQGSELRRPEFRTPGIYRYVRHPIYLGWLLILWSAPVMTITHLVLAAGMTMYMLAGIQLEERDLAAELPEYEQYKRKVPMLLPSPRKRLIRNMD